MKIIVLVNGHPSPATSGAALRELGIIELLRELGATELVSVLRPGDASGGIEISGVKTHFVERERAPLPRRLVYPFRPYILNGYSTRVEKKLAELFAPGALLWVSRLAMAQYIPAAKKMGYRVVLDQHNIESDYYFDSIRANGRWRELPLAWQMQRKERQFCRASDRVVVTSVRDRQLLQSLACREALIIPNCVSPPAEAAPNGDAKNLLFVGTLDYAPNVEGLRWFLASWPQLKADNFRLRVAGARPSAELQNLIRKAGAEIFVSPASLEPHYEWAGVCLAPILSGGGTRIKIIEALGRGKALVSTPKGAEGLDVRHGEHLLLAETGAEFVAGIRRLARHQEERSRLEREGRRLVQESYSWAAQLGRVRAICEI